LNRKKGPDIPVPDFPVYSEHRVPIPAGPWLKFLTKKIRFLNKNIDRKKNDTTISIFKTIFTKNVIFLNTYRIQDKCKCFASFIVQAGFPDANEGRIFQYFSNSFFREIGTLCVRNRRSFRAITATYRQ